MLQRARIYERLCRGDAVQLLDTSARAAVQSYSTLSLSIVYLNASGATTKHFSGGLVPLPDDSSIYEIGSITKTFTGTLLATAAASPDLAVSLDTPVKVQDISFFYSFAVYTNTGFQCSRGGTGVGITFRKRRGNETTTAPSMRGD